MTKSGMDGDVRGREPYCKDIGRMVDYPSHWLLGAGFWVLAALLREALRQANLRPTPVINFINSSSPLGARSYE